MYKASIRNLLVISELGGGGYEEIAIIYIVLYRDKGFFTELLALN